jgi:hypothetical protein
MPQFQYWACLHESRPLGLHAFCLEDPLDPVKVLVFLSDNTLPLHGDDWGRLISKYSSTIQGRRRWILNGLNCMHSFLAPTFWYSFGSVI